MKVIPLRGLRTHDDGHAGEVLPANDLPALEEVIPAVDRRPGDLHENVRVGERASGLLSEMETEFGLNANVVAALALETNWVLCALPEDRRPKIHQFLNRAAADVRVQRVLRGGEAKYVRSLSTRRGAGLEGRQRSTISLPIRLHSRFTDTTLVEALESIPMEDAIAWETAAVLAGCSISEWMLATALRDCWR